MDQQVYDSLMPNTRLVKIIIKNTGTLLKEFRMSLINIKIKSWVDWTNLGPKFSTGQ